MCDKEDFMEIDLITKDDLEKFRVQLLNDFSDILKKHLEPKQEWLKSKDVVKMLKISPGTLQTLRINGTLRSSKVGGMLFYKQEDILSLLERNLEQG
jgi:hypothetical protein